MAKRMLIDALTEEYAGGGAQRQPLENSIRIVDKKQ